MDWKVTGMPRWVSRADSSACSCPLTSAPRTATPITAPTSRLVLVADAAMPDRSGGTAPSTDDVTGTTQVPIPIPVSARAAATGRYGGVGAGAGPRRHGGG